MRRVSHSRSSHGKGPALRHSSRRLLRGVANRAAVRHRFRCSRSTWPSAADADRAFLRDGLELRGIDVGEGCLIFGWPPAEVDVDDNS
jgi:hypothetical protein